MKTGKKAYTTEEIILRALAEGCTRRTAAHLAGVSEDTYYKWVETDPGFAQETERAQAAFLRSVLPVIKRHPQTALKYAQMVGRQDEQLQNVVEKVEASGKVVIEIVRDGSDPKRTPTGPPP